MINEHQRQRWHFLKNFLRNPMEVGAIAPSSQELAKMMTADLHLRPGDTVIELGPGTGALTTQIRHILPDTQYYIGIECEARFVHMLQKSFPDMRFVKGRAEHAVRLHRQSGLAPVRAIISGIPFANHWGGDLRTEIIDTLEQLMAPGCVFRTFQYVHAYTLPPALRFRKEMSDRFGNYRRSRVVFRNLPPAFVLTWRR